MERNIKLEKISNNIFRMSVSEFDIDNEIYFLKNIIKVLFKNNTEITLIGYRENTFWKSDEEVSSIKETIAEDFNKIGYFKINEKTNYFILSAEAKINHFNLNNLKEIIDFWNLFENTFILQSNNLTKILSNDVTFSNYINLLENKDISFSITKAGSNEICVDSQGLDILNEIIL